MKGPSNSVSRPMTAREGDAATGAAITAAPTR